VSKVNFRAVSGIVTLWGRLEVGVDEVRAENAQIQCLAIYSRWTERHKQSVRTIAAEFGVEVVDLYDLPEAAVTYGSALPSTIVPAAGGARSVLVAA